MTTDLFKECKNFDFDGWGVVTCGDSGRTQQVRGMKSSEFVSNIKNERDFLRSRILEIQRFGTI